MNTLDLTDVEPTTTHSNGSVRLPYGLLGFEGVKNYSLLARPDDAPFLWFQMENDARQAFLLVPPLEVLPSYDPDLDDQDVRFLQLDDPADAIVLNIVTLRAKGKSTVNLKGPIVINRKTWVGKQVIPKNAANYTVNHPLPIN